MTVAWFGMYDWPEVRAATDALWGCIRDVLRADGVAAPDRLDRDLDGGAAWTAPTLVLAQTCGLPLALGRCGGARVIAAGDYGPETGPPGWYHSVIIARRGEPAPARVAVAAVNGPESQSGYVALLGFLADRTPAGPPRLLTTGSHRGSIRAVAAGKAEVAAIDAVSWRLARRYEPSASGVEVVARSPAVPGLPFITGPDMPHERVLSALVAGVGALDPASRSALGLRAVVPAGNADYAGFGLPD